MIPSWKVVREFSRLRQQLRSIPEFFWEPIARRRHDRLMEQGPPITLGAQGLLPKVAIVLLYQPSGVAKSIGVQYRHLAACGYSILLVSNTALTATDRDDLAALVWRIVERPNFGYDFGGYRDGILLLQGWGVKPERLVIMNDSIWFPLWDRDDTLFRMEAMDVDVAGSVLRVRGKERFLESYLYSIRGAVLATPSFLAFWKNYRLTSNKYKVIRRGERGFSAAMSAAGLTLAGVFDKTDFIARLAAVSDAELRVILQYTANQIAEVEQEGRNLANAAGEAGWREAAHAYVARVLAKAMFYSSFPVAAAQLLHYPIMKKSAEPISVRWRSAFVAAVLGGALQQPIDEIFDEMLKLEMVKFDDAPPRFGKLSENYTEFRISYLVSVLTSMNPLYGSGTKDGLPKPQGRARALLLLAKRSQFLFCFSRTV